MKVVLYTADRGGHDDVQPIVAQEGLEVEVVRFTEPLVFSGQDTPWNDRLEARWYKTHPHVLFPISDVTIWVDACLEITDPHFALEVVTGLDWGVGLFPHPDRSTVWEEIKAAETLGKYDGAEHFAMVTSLAQVGIEPDPLYAMTVMARRTADLTVRVADEITWQTTLAWSTPDVTALDQLILPFALAWASADVVPFTRPGTLWDNRWFRRHPHRRET